MGAPDRIPRMTIISERSSLLRAFAVLWVPFPLLVACGGTAPAADPATEVPARSGVAAQEADSGPGLMHEGKSLATWISELRDESDGGMRSRASSALGRAGARAVPLLRALLRDRESDHGQWEAFLALEQMGLAAAPAAPDVAPHLEVPDLYARQGALRALAVMGDAAAPYVDDMARLLDVEPSAVSGEAARALAALGERARQTAPRILALLASSDSAERSAAAEALARLGLTRLEEASGLLELCDSEDWQARDAGTRGVQRLDARSAGALADLVSDGESQLRLRARAATELGRIGSASDPRIVEALEAASSALDPLGPAARAALESLRQH